MSRLRQVLLGALVALISISIVVGGISLALQESGRALALRSPVSTPRPPGPTSPGRLTPPPGGTVTAPLVITQTPDACPPPPGWVILQVQSGDTLQELAAALGLSVETLARENCLPAGVDEVPPGSTLNVPAPTPTETSTVTSTPSDATACQPPAGWIPYVVEPQDNLFRLSRAYGVSVSELQEANCLNSTLIVRGTVLYVPNVPTRVPSRTPRPTRTPTARPTRTPTGVPPSATPTILPPTVTTTSPADTPTPTASPSPTVQPTLTPMPTETPAPSATPTLTESPTEPPPSASPMFTPTPTDSAGVPTVTPGGLSGG